MCDVTICLIAGKKVSFGKSSMLGGFKEPEQITGRDEVADYTTGPSRRRRRQAHLILGKMRNKQ